MTQVAAQHIPPKGFSSVSIPRWLAEKIDAFVERKKPVYKTRVQVIEVAVVQLLGEEEAILKKH